MIMGKALAKHADTSYTGGGKGDTMKSPQEALSPAAKKPKKESVKLGLTGKLTPLIKGLVTHRLGVYHG